jgi:acyl carrier protein
MNIEETVITLIQKELESIDNISPANKLVEIGFDSLKFIKLVVAMEGTLDIVFDDEDLNYLKFPTIEDLIQYASRKKGIPA